MTTVRGRADRQLAEDTMKLSLEDQKRLALTECADVDVNDPRNAQYLKPLSIAQDEEMAQDMAEWCFCFGARYEQALINMRRMLRDKEYWTLTGGGDWPRPLH